MLCVIWAKFGTYYCPFSYYPNPGNAVKVKFSADLCLILNDIPFSEHSTLTSHKAQQQRIFTPYLKHKTAHTLILLLVIVSWLQKCLWVIRCSLWEVLEFVCHQSLIVGSTSIWWFSPCLWFVVILAMSDIRDHTRVFASFGQRITNTIYWCEPFSKAFLNGFFSHCRQTVFPFPLNNDCLTLSNVKILARFLL